MRTRIAIAEDNDMLASSIEEKLSFFSDETDFRFRACNGQDLLERLIKDDSVDVILMDIEMPVMNGIKATENVRKLYPGIKIIMLTVFDDEEKIFQSIQAGAIGYMLKDELPDKIVEGIKIVTAGGAAMSPVIAAKSLALLRNAELRQESNSAIHCELSRREIEVLEQLSRGLNYNQIAENLFVSPFTVRKHIENIYQKLHVHNKIEAVRIAKDQKII